MANLVNRRDHVEVVEETELVEHTFFTDLNFSHDCRVSQIRWHPMIEGIVAMSVVENTIYEEYLNNLTKRLVMPTMIMIWSMSHPLFPQILLRVPDDVTVIGTFVISNYYYYCCTKKLIEFDVLTM